MNEKEEMAMVEHVKALAGHLDASMKFVIDYLAGDEKREQAEKIVIEFVDWSVKVMREKP